MSALRAERVGDQLKRELAKLFQNDLKDPRIPAFTCITAVKMTSDLSYATCYVSVFGDRDGKKACLAALKQATGFLRREVGKAMRLRIVPELNFVLDESVETGLKMSKFIDDTLARDAELKNQAIRQNSDGAVAKSEIAESNPTEPIQQN